MMHCNRCGLLVPHQQAHAITEEEDECIAALHAALSIFLAWGEKEAARSPSDAKANVAADTALLVAKRHAVTLLRRGLKQRPKKDGEATFGKP